MMISLELPEEALVAAIRKLSPAKRKRVLKALQNDIDTPFIRLIRLPAKSLRRLDGLISVGGDALIDSERFYDDVSH